MVVDGVAFEHAVGDDDVGFAPPRRPPAGAGGGEGGELPEGMEMDDVEGGDVLAEPAIEGVGDGVARGAVDGKGVQLHGGVEGDGGLTGVPEGGDGDVVAAGGERGGEAGADGGGAADFGGDADGDVEDAEGGGRLGGLGGQGNARPRKDRGDCTRGWYPRRGLW